MENGEKCGGRHTKKEGLSVFDSVILYMVDQRWLGRGRRGKNMSLRIAYRFEIGNMASMCLWDPAKDVPCWPVHTDVQTTLLLSSF